MVFLVLITDFLCISNDFLSYYPYGHNHLLTEINVSVGKVNGTINTLNNQMYTYNTSLYGSNNFLNDALKIKQQIGYKELFKVQGELLTGITELLKSPCGKLRR